MSGGTNQTEGSVGVPLEYLLDGIAGGSSGHAGDLPGCRADGGIGADKTAPLFTEISHILHIVIRVHAFQSSLTDLAEGTLATVCVECNLGRPADSRYDPRRIFRETACFMFEKDGIRIE
jgi:hypothetical protein